MGPLKCFIHLSSIYVVFAGRQIAFLFPSMYLYKRIVRIVHWIFVFAFNVFALVLLKKLFLNTTKCKTIDVLCQVYNREKEY